MLGLPRNVRLPIRTAQDPIRKVVIGPHLAHGEEGIPGVIPPDAKITAEIKVLR